MFPHGFRGVVPSYGESVTEKSRSHHGNQEAEDSNAGQSHGTTHPEDTPHGTHLLRLGPITSFLRLPTTLSCMNLSMHSSIL